MHIVQDKTNKQTQSGIVLHFCKQICKILQLGLISLVRDSWILRSAAAFSLRLKTPLHVREWMRRKKSVSSIIIMIVFKTLRGLQITLCELL